MSPSCSSCLSEENTPTSARLQSMRSCLSNLLAKIGLKHEAATGGPVSVPLPLPGLKVTDVGVVALPVQERQAIALSSSSACKQHPVEQEESKDSADGTKATCRYIKADDITLSSLWTDAVATLVNGMAKKIGIEDRKITAKLDKLLFYAPHELSSDHQDTERNARAFGSIYIQLPSEYEGGGIVISHGDQSHTFDFSKNSDVQFHAVSFYAESNLQVKPIESGHRLFLVYNLLRPGTGPVPSLPLRPEVVQKELITVADLWEGLSSHDDECATKIPELYAVRLKHNYNRFNFGFKEVRGLDYEMVESIRKTERYHMNLLLMRKLEFNRMTEGCDCEYCDPADTTERAVEVRKYIPDPDCELMKNMKLKIVKKDMVDGKEIFKGCPSYENEDEWEGMYETHYISALLVIWPRAMSAQVVCRSGFADGVSFLSKSVKGEKNGAKQVLEGTMEFAAKNLAKSQPRLQELLQVTTDMKDLAATQKVLYMMADKSVGEKVGIWSERHVRLVASAVEEFGWPHLASAVLLAIENTHWKEFQHCIGLFHKLGKSELEEDGDASIVKRFMLKLSQEVDERKDMFVKVPMGAVAGIAKVVFSDVDFSAERGKFLSYLKVLHPFALSDALLALKDMKFSAETPVILVKQIRTIAVALIANARRIENPKPIASAISALHECEYLNDSNASILRKFPRLLDVFTDAAFREEYQEKLKEIELHIEKVWSVLLECQDEELLAKFSDAAIQTKNVDLLKALLGERFLKYAGNASLEKMAQSLLPLLDRPNPSISNRQLKANVLNHPEVTEFLRGDELKMRYANFSGVTEARKWCARNFGEWRLDPNIRVSANAGGRGKTAYVDLHKSVTPTNEELFLAEVEKNKEDKKHIAKLAPFLNVESKADEAAVKPEAMEGVVEVSSIGPLNRT